jgi:uncharacterized protein (DUF302 family)
MPVSIKKMLVSVVMFGFAVSAQAQSTNSLAARSASDFASTKMKLVESIKSKGFGLIAEVDHAAGATGAGLQLLPTHLVIFGNPRGGTPVMNCNQAAGIDLPLKALVWQAADGSVNVMVNTPSLLTSRHGLGDCAAQPIANMGKALEGIVSDAAKP